MEEWGGGRGDVCVFVEKQILVSIGISRQIQAFCGSSAYIS